MWGGDRPDVPNCSSKWKTGAGWYTGCRPYGTCSELLSLTPHLRAGLSYAVPSGLGWGGSGCVFSPEFLRGRQRLKPG